jgi:septal ring factor EnvC (AmiA/AmiB activator)
MSAGLSRWVTRSALIPSPLLLLLAGCAPAVRSASAPPAVAAPDTAEASSGSTLQARVTVLNEKLSQEQQRSASLQAQLSERGDEIEELHAEVRQLRDRGTEGAVASAPAAAEAHTGGVAGEHAAAAPGGGTGGTDAGSPDTAAADNMCRDETQTATLVASLRAALSEEQQRRQAAETQLARLQEETGGSPYGNDMVSAADYAAAKQEIVELRRGLDAERAAREVLARDLRALQQSVSHDGSAGEDTSAAGARDQARLENLQTQRQAVVDNLTRSLAASQERTAELEAQLAARGTDGDVTAMRAENAALRTQLDEEHRHTEQLASKLKMAARVTDLIFKLQAQRPSAPPGSAPAMEMR